MCMSVSVCVSVSMRIYFSSMSSMVQQIQSVYMRCVVLGVQFGRCRLHNGQSGLLPCYIAPLTNWGYQFLVLQSKQ